MRGKPGFELDSEVAVRIIPARAGQTAGSQLLKVRHADHPRACGANSTDCEFRVNGHGSSPRVRGKLEPVGAGHERFRIIPARAGQTSAAVGSGSRRSDHPRACGANVRVHTMLLVRSGSSPRVRGKPRLSITRHHSYRIIPARAGQTTSKHGARGVKQDHPRACGANHQ